MQCVLPISTSTHLDDEALSQSTNAQPFAFHAKLRFIAPCSQSDRPDSLVGSPFEMNRFLPTLCGAADHTLELTRQLPEPMIYAWLQRRHLFACKEYGKYSLDFPLTSSLHALRGEQREGGHLVRITTCQWSGGRTANLIRNSDLGWSTYPRPQANRTWSKHFPVPNGKSKPNLAPFLDGKKLEEQNLCCSNPYLGGFCHIQNQPVSTDFGSQPRCSSSVLQYISSFQFFGPQCNLYASNGALHSA